MSAVEDGVEADHEETFSIDYKPPGDTIAAFFASDKFCRVVQGPFGSGKSVSCCMELMRRAREQAPSPVDGVRYTRWVAIRNTHAELELTTIQGWLEWFPEKVFGPFQWTSPYTHHFQIDEAGGTIDLEIIFLALDRPDDVKKLKSLNITGVWVNEASEVDKAIIDVASSRCRRFPAVRNGGCTWGGIIMDTNAPPSNHWISLMSGQVPLPEWMTQEERQQYALPDNWGFYIQPAAMLEIRNARGEVSGYRLNPKAENVANLAKNYYDELIGGKDWNWIQVYILNRPGRARVGKVVFPTYNQEEHSVGEPWRVREAPVVVGADTSGLTPGAVFIQQWQGIWHVFYEIVADNTGAEAFGMVLRQAIFRKVPPALIKLVQLWGDPAGKQRQPGDKEVRSYLNIIRAQAGLMIQPAPFQELSVRLDTVRQVLARGVGKSKGLVVHRLDCPVLHEGFVQEYHYRRIISAGERYEERPYKNRASAVHDALQYGLGGAGESRQLLVTGKMPLEVARAKRGAAAGYSPYDRMGAIGKERRGWQGTRRRTGS